MEVFQKVETKTSLIWTWKNMPTLILFQGFFCFCPIFYVKKYTRKSPKMDFVVIVFGPP
jgi:hypothetical protein